MECKCKRPRCPTCSKCSRCGCDHDGIPILVKLNRKRGGQKGARAKGLSANRSHGDQSRIRCSAGKGDNIDSSSSSADVSENESAGSSDRTFEHEIYAEPTNPYELREMTTRTVGEENITLDLPVSKSKKADRAKVKVSLFAVEKAMGLNGDLTKKLPPKCLRGYGSTDECIDEQGWRALVNSFRRGAYELAKIMYPKNPDILIALGARGRNSSPIYEDVESSLENELLLNVLDREGESQKNSVQKKTLRAVLCQSVRRKDLMKLASESDSFSISEHSYKEGRKDFMKMTAGLSLKAPIQSRKRYS